VRAAQPDSKGACWCVKETFPPELCARVPEKEPVPDPTFAEARRREQAVRDLRKRRVVIRRVAHECGGLLRRWRR